MFILKFSPVRKLSKDIPGGSLVGLLPSAVTVMEGSKVLSIAQYWAIACAASCTVKAFGLPGAVVPVSTAVSNRLQEIVQLGSSSDGRDSPKMSLTTSDFLY
jgi:hypothetical protein